MGWQFTTFAFSQAMSCISFEACSVTADCWTFPDTRALLCSFRRWSNVLPVCPMYTFCNHQMESDTPHLPTAMGVCRSSGAPKFDGGCGEVKNRCKPPRVSGSSVLSLTGGGYTVGPLWPWVCLTSQVGGVCCGFPVLGDQLPIHPQHLGDMFLSFILSEKSLQILFARVNKV